MKFNIEELKNSPRKSSKDCLELMHVALEINDKEWFEELGKEKAQLEKREKEVREELGFTGKVE